HPNGGRIEKGRLRALVSGCGRVGRGWGLACFQVPARRESAVGREISDAPLPHLLAGGEGVRWAPPLRLLRIGGVRGTGGGGGIRRVLPDGRRVPFVFADGETGGFIPRPVDGIVGPVRQRRAGLRYGRGKIGRA